MGRVTIFQDILTTDKAYHMDVDVAFSRIKNGKSKDTCERIRACESKDEQNNIKKKLPCVLFTGEFNKRHNDGCDVQSKLIILDFDKVLNIEELKESLKKRKFIYACWLSPSATGLKALVKVSTKDHLSHFLALEKIFPNLDKAGKDLARVCYESYDPDIYINPKPEVFEGQYFEPKNEVKVDTTTSDYKFKALLTWLQSKGSSFVDGNRNNFVFTLASACNRIGMSKGDCEYNIGVMIAGTGFEKEAAYSIDGVYKRYQSTFGAFEMKENEVYDKHTKENVTSKIYDGNDFSEDTITFESVWDELLTEYANGITKGDSTHILEIDQHFRWMKGQINLLHGFGNFGKSTFLMQLALIKSLYDGTKWCFFSPEQMPPTFFYRDLIQALMGKTMDNKRFNPVTIYELNQIKDFVHSHFILTYPKKNNPTPDYIMDRLFENVITNKIDSCVIDPFNQLAHKWGARDDHYLEDILTRFKRFTKQNNVYFTITTHPKNPGNPDPNYDMPTPDFWNIAGGAMWNNVMDNILVYHRPKHHIDKTDQSCIFGSQKIRFQQMNGIPGDVIMIYDRKSFRFFVNDKSPLDNDFVKKRLNLDEKTLFSGIEPNKEFDKSDDQFKKLEDEIPF